jgi:UMF1 family MFS transporter
MPADTRALGAIGEMFQDSGDERQVPRREVRSWAMWDWATQPFNSVILTFVFVSLYLVSDHFLPADIAASRQGPGEGASPRRPLERVPV